MGNSLSLGPRMEQAREGVKADQEGLKARVGQ